ncbi:MAG: endolytic transglycosylase MltG [Patescibacteria group bacterium]|nr:endolytic transglycosylase MltG [Patescibacteria group bacterium]
MTFNGKICLISVLILLAVPGIGYVYYRQTHPKYIPPKIEPRQEINVTIIPGWNLRQVADDWTKKGIIKNADELFALLGEPAKNYKAIGAKAPVLALASDTAWAELFGDKPTGVSYEGFLFPDTYRVYADAQPEDVLKKIFTNLNEKITPEMREAIKNQKKSFYEILTMASVVEKEAPTKSDMAKVADIFWRRYERNWALQSCATVNYITGKNDPGVSNEDKAINSLFNTYKYPGLPLGAISNPGLEAIRAVIYPEKNNFWYFMSDTDGVTHYATTLEEHNANVHKYLK